MSELRENTVAINQLKGDHFFVEDYQRGYKWGIQQVQELLTDIHEFNRAGIESFYCLQPVVVKSDSSAPNKYELIDGQQRLTTIYIILQCLGEKVYELTYRTRDNSEAFLNNISTLETVSSFDTNANIDSVITPFLHNAWKDFTSNSPKGIDNVDNLHFYCAYQFIKAWLQSIEDVEEFKTNLLHYARVIWHEQTGSDSAEEVFIKFNQGKIELAQAELIKALFVLQINEEKNVELRSFRLNQFAEEWNIIENQLQDDTFWFFVSNDVSDDKKSNRIDLLFDLLKEKPKGSNNKLYSYHQYLELYSQKKELEWSEVNDLFNQLYEWYHDRELYHLVGFIIYAGIKTIAEINSLYAEVVSKIKFKQKLKGIIDKSFSNEKKKQKFDLDYLESIEYGSNNKEIELILVLHNVVNYQFTDNYYRFPFDRLKLEQGWSLEHIHAQKTDKFEQIQEITNWINDIRELKANYQKDEGISETALSELEEKICAVQEKLDEKDITPKNGELKSRVKALDEKATSYFGKDKLNNLCLLDRRTNSSIGNKFFPLKRQMILGIDKMALEEYNRKYGKEEKTKPFIPLATKHVFLKYFTKLGDLQMTFWGAEDRMDYLNHIQSGIDKFLKTEVEA